MSFKTFKCCICGNEVTKPRSYAIEGKGRACREHQEAQEAHVSAVEADKAKQEKQKRSSLKPAIDELNRAMGIPTKNFRPPMSYCWCCKRDGMHKSEVARKYLEMSDDSSKEDIVNFIDSVVELNDFKPFREVPGFRYIPLAEKQESPVWRILDREMRQLVEFTNVTFLCRKCASKHNIDWTWNAPTMEQLNALMSIGLFSDVT